MAKAAKSDLKSPFKDSVLNWADDRPINRINGTVFEQLFNVRPLLKKKWIFCWDNWESEDAK